MLNYLLIALGSAMGGGLVTLEKVRVIDYRSGEETAAS
jgi:hypothetical protein